VARKTASKSAPKNPRAGGGTADRAGSPPTATPAGLHRPGTDPARQIPRLGDVLGQSAALAALGGALASGRVHHCWIFSGPAGVGKFTAALAFAAVLLDPTSRPADDGLWSPEPQSPTQRLLLAGTHPDLHIITKELAAISRDDRTRQSKQRTIPLDVLREFLIEPSGRTRGASTGDGALAQKVFIVDEAELLRDGQNTLLKTLEEPPVGTVLILVTASEEALLPTVRSRARRVGFTALDEPALRAWYERAGMPRDEVQREWLMRFGCGSPGWIASAVASNLYGWEGVLGPGLRELAAGRFPLGLGSELAKLVEERAAESVRASPDSSKEAATAAWAGRLLGLVAEHLRLMLRQAAGKGAEVAWHLAGIDLVTAAAGQVGANVSLPLVTESLVAQLAAAPRQRT